ncbi:MAG: hypothetical protein ACTHK2_08595 [Dokdonella sp.]|uniref:hypothetical protein n=1 Tax=Dokdonella sp. TaxID=2291710 RepID=UPI003F81FF1D
MSIKGTIASTLAAAAVILGVDAQAMHVDPQGLGQVLVFPYYSANGGNDTLFAITNTRAHAKAVRVRFHEGYDGRGVLDLDVYLPPHGAWSASVTAPAGDASPARLVTGDDACTVPALASRSIDFSGTSYAGENAPTGPTGHADGGPQSADRTREGHFDVFEMGEVTGNQHGSAQAIATGDCAAIAAAWAPGGAWDADPDADLGAPAGGLYGVEYVVDVARGTMFGVDAVAIDGFRAAPMHTAPGAAMPDLDSASAGADGRYAALVGVNGGPRTLQYERPVDAVSALFMAASLEGDYTRSESIGARTDWIVTAPTKRFYVDPALAGGAATPPFEVGFAHSYTSGQMTVHGGVVEQWASAYPYACANVAAVSYGRDGIALALAAANAGGGVDPTAAASNPALTPCLETSVLAFMTAPDSSGIDLPVSAIGSRLTNATDPGAHVSRNVSGIELLPAAGSLSLDLAHDMRGAPIASHALAAASNGDVLIGLPVVAFSATTFVNDHVSEGVLANYGASAKVRSRVACMNTGGACR